MSSYSELSEQCTSWQYREIDMNFGSSQNLIFRAIVHPFFNTFIFGIYIFVFHDNIAFVLIFQNLAKMWESTEGYSRWKIEKRHSKFGKTGLNQLEQLDYWSITSPKKGQNQLSPEKLEATITKILVLVFRKNVNLLFLLSGVLFEIWTSPWFSMCYISKIVQDGMF